MSDGFNFVHNRKTALISATAMLILGTLAGVFAQSASIVPWINQPAAAVAAAAQVAAQRPCATSDLQITLDNAGAFRGMATQEILLVNRGTGSCYVAGVPSAQLHPTGTPAQTVALSTALATRASERFDLSPGEGVAMLIGTPGTCAAADKLERNPITDLSVALLGGGSVTLDGAYVDTTCGPATLVGFHQLDTATTAGPFGQLAGSLSAPRAAVRGQTMRYTVTLSNPIDKAISLSPCPSYNQSLNSDDKTSSQTLRLNCEGAGGQIPAQSSVTFEMQAPVPADFDGQGVKLSWTLQDGPTVGTIMQLQ
jgi:uncharacterized protein DUF4232